MRKKLLICAAAVLTIAAGSVSLAKPARAEAAMGCTLEEYSYAIRFAHEACRVGGHKSGTVVECHAGDGTTPYGVEAECWS